MADAPDRKTIAKVMKTLDICMMSTRADGDGGIATRPMSNNGEVDYDGDNWFFSHGDTAKVRQIEADPAVSLGFQGEGVWLTVEGEATLHREDKALFEQHWSKDIDAWFEDGIDTPGLTLIQVHAARIELWGREGDGVVDMT